MFSTSSKEMKDKKGAPVKKNRRRKIPALVPAPRSQIKTGATACFETRICASEGCQLGSYQPGGFGFSASHAV
jgi:hypothetical protein